MNGRDERDIPMKSKNALTPFLIGAVGIAAGLVMAYYRIMESPQGLEWATGGILALYLAWVLSEFRITAGEATKDTSDDRGTCEAYALARLLTVATALAVDSVWTSPGLWLVPGVALMLGGILLRASAIRTLGRSYSHRVRRPEAENIIDDGPYRFLRHPAYSGMLLAHVGFVLLFFSGPLVLVFTAVFIPVLVRRILLEERYLLTNLPAYDLFAQGRARLVPGLW